MINRRIAISAISIATALTMLAGSTFAFFSDTAASNGNSFAAGSLDLKIGTANPAASDSISAVFTSTAMIPGGTPGSATIHLLNSGSVAGNKLYFKAGNLGGVDNNTDQPIPMARLINVTLTYDGVPVVIPDANLNTRADLDDIALGGNGLQIGILTNLGVDHTLVMTAGLDSSADNPYVNDSVTADFTATLTQD